MSVGFGHVPTGFENFGEETERRTRAELLDEGLDIETNFWNGRPFDYAGKHYQVHDLDALESPLRWVVRHSPVAVVGAGPHERSMRRVLRYDSLLPNVLDVQANHVEPTLDHIRDVANYVNERPRTDPPFDIIAEGQTPGDASKAADIVRPMAEAGATWWIEPMFDAPDLDEVWERLRQGRQSSNSYSRATKGI